jgi:alkylhydroperoxidase family enzyme
MNCFKKIDSNDASDEVKNLYSTILKTLNIKLLPNWVSYLGTNFSTLNLVWNAYKTVYTEGNLTILLKELILFSVSRAQMSPYCTEYHASNILKLSKNLSYNELVALTEKECHGCLPDSYYTAVGIATKHSQDRCNLAEEDFDKLEEAGFNQVEIIEIMNTCSIAMFISTLTLAGNIPIDETHKVDGFYLTGV